MIMIFMVNQISILIDPRLLMVPGNIWALQPPAIVSVWPVRAVRLSVAPSWASPLGWELWPPAPRTNSCLLTSADDQGISIYGMSTQWWGLQVSGASQGSLASTRPVKDQILTSVIDVLIKSPINNTTEHTLYSLKSPLSEYPTCQAVTLVNIEHFWPKF